MVPMRILISPSWPRFFLKISQEAAKAWRAARISACVCAWVVCVCACVLCALLCVVCACACVFCEMCCARKRTRILLPWLLLYCSGTKGMNLANIPSAYLSLISHYKDCNMLLNLRELANPLSEKKAIFEQRGWMVGLQCTLTAF